MPPPIKRTRGNPSFKKLGQQIQKASAKTEHEVVNVINYLSFHGWTQWIDTVTTFIMITVVAFIAVQETNHARYGRHVSEYPMPWFISSIGLTNLIIIWLSFITVLFFARIIKAQQTGSYTHEKEHREMHRFMLYNGAIGVLAVTIVNPSPSFIIAPLFLLYTLPFLWDFVATFLAWFTDQIHTFVKMMQ